MPKKSPYYDDVKYIKHKHTKFAFLWWILFPCMIAGVVLLAMFFSGVLAGDFSLFSRYNYKTEQITYYGLSFGTYDDKETAQSVANGVVLQGASGYIWEQDNKYIVLGSIYMTYEDCQSVISNITGTNYNMNVFEITLPKIKKNIDEYEILKLNFEYMKQTIKLLYDTSIGLDTKVMTNLQVSSTINSQRSDGMVQKDNASLYILSTPSKYLDESIIALQHIIDTQDELVYKLIEDTSSSYSLRYALCSVVDNVYQFVNNIKNI